MDTPEYGYTHWDRYVVSYYKSHDFTEVQLEELIAAALGLPASVEEPTGEQTKPELMRKKVRDW